jgi:RNA polymerase sigma-70 factor (ECF subfamily)
MGAAIERELAAGRHARAFDLIVPEFKDRVFRLAFSILRDATAAEDASQETFVRIWKALPGFDGRAALGTWIYAITRNTCLM